MKDMKEIIDEVKYRSDIAEIISDYVKLQPAGANYKGLCPFHNEKTPSFHVNTSKQIYRCFGCGEGGDVISFIMKTENLDFMDAVRFLANRCGIEINNNIDHDTKLKLERINKFQSIHIEAARFYYSNLIKDENPALNYLKKRGLDLRTIKNFGLGYAYDSWDLLKNHLVSKGYGEHDILESGLLSKSSKSDKIFDKFRNRVMFPIFDYRGKVIGFGGRVIDDGQPKYLNSPDSEIFNKRYNLYGLNFARKHIGNQKKLILVEGYMDLISLYQFGIKNTVATLGTALTDEQAELISRYADTLVLSYDSDQAGINASMRAIDILEKHGLSVRILDLGNSKDPDEFIREHGMTEMYNAIENAIESNRFKLNILSKDYNLDDRKDSMKYLIEAVKIVRNIKSPIEQDYYINILSKMTATNAEIIKNEMNGKKSVYKNDYTKKYNNTDRVSLNIKKPREVEDPNSFVEMNLISAIMKSEKAREIARFKLSEDDLTDNNSKIIYSKVLKFDVEGIIRNEDIFDESISLDYLNRLSKVNLSGVDLYNIIEIDKLIMSLLEKNKQVKIDKLLKKQKQLENRRKTIDDNSKEAEEVDLEIMKIALDIVAENKKNHCRRED
nr:DNA primase [uncultured Peptostreptococcus sp.]